MTRNKKVYDNEITYLGPQGQSGAVADFHQQMRINGGNSFGSNLHRVSNSARRPWAWGQFVDWNGFRAAGQEPNGELGPITDP